jgi:hypothetical protein
MGIHIHEDSIELAPRELDFLVATRAKLYRPSQFRSILRVDRSVPEWANRIELRVIESFAEPVVIKNTSDNLPTPTIDMSSATQPVYQYGLAYQVTRRQILQARQLGQDLESVYSVANQTATETFLDAVAAGVHTTGKPALPGLTSAGTTPIQTLANITAASDPDTVLAYLHSVINAVAENSKENFRADTLAMPLALYHIIVSMRLGTTTDGTVLTALLRESPYVKKVVSWNRLATLGTAGYARRIVAFDSVAAEGPRMVIAKELTDAPPIPKGLGWEVPQDFVTAGVAVDAHETVAYLDVKDP